MKVRGAVCLSIIWMSGVAAWAAGSATIPTTGGVLPGRTEVSSSSAPAAQADLPAVPRIESVLMAPRQPQADAPTTIWYDDFDGPKKPYTEAEGDIDPAAGFGGQGGAMLCLYEQDRQGRGNRKVFFGDSPVGKVVRKGETFNEIYWRIYVKHQEGWRSGTTTPDRGGPDKMSRATSIVSPKWQQAMIAHVWSTGDTLTLDPASGVRDGQVVTTRYNDFALLHWLGNRPAAQTAVQGAAEASRWICVESRARLNTPSKKDGLNQLWIDGRLEAERKDLDWRGTYQGFGINAVFLEAYWNKGSPVTQKRWYDNFVIATVPIGPVLCPRQPTLFKTPYRGPGVLRNWQVELAADPAGQAVVWRSGDLGDHETCTVTGGTGRFTGTLAGQEQLGGGQVYFCRVRQRGEGAWSEWSPWHQAFRTEP